MTLSLRQWTVLKTVADVPGISQRAIHVSTDIPPTTVTGSLLSLENENMIRRITTINGDNRSYEFYLTDGGACALAGRCL